MRIPVLVTVVSMLALAGCTAPAPQVGPDGRPLPRVYQMPSNADAAIPYEMLDSVNALRSAAGAPALQLSAELNAAAATHARDMSNQGRPWHFGSDGSSPLDRIQRVGYSGGLIGETISETYETEIETLAAWMDEEATRRVILDPRATDLGVSWYQEPNGKIWWTMLLGSRDMGTATPGVANATGTAGL